MKAEWKYLQNIRQNFDIEHLETLTRQAEVEPPVTAPKRPSARRSQSPRASPAAAAPLVPEQPSDILRVVKHIPGPMRAAAITQGGATVWVAEPQGGLTIRSGTTAQPAVEITTSSDSIVHVLYPTHSQMWVGFASGMVHVYNHLVFMFVTEGTFHSAAVTAFVEMDDGRVFSASADGSLVKWEGAEHNFEALARIIPGHEEGGVACLCGGSHGVFSGADDGSIIRVDADTGRKVQSYVSHRSAVKAMVLANDYLFSGDAAGCVVVWNINSAEVLRTFEPAGAGGIVSFVSIPQADQLWEVTSEGGLFVRSTLPDMAFDVQRQIPTEVPFQPVAVIAQDAVETAMVWTMSSDGVNKVWSSTSCSAEGAMVEASELMRDIVDQDTAELERWKGLLSRLKVTTVKRRQIVVDSLSKYFAVTLLGRYMSNWRSVASERWRRRRLTTTANNLLCQTQRKMLQSGMSRWVIGVRVKLHRALQGRAISAVAAMSEKSVAHRYYSAWSLFYRIARLRQRRRSSAAYLGNSHNGALMQRYATLWATCTQRRKMGRTLKRYMSTMIGSQEQSLRHRYFLHWMGRLRYHRRLIQLKSLRVFGLLQANDARSVYFARWIRFRGVKRRRHLRAATTALMQTAADNRHREQFWVLWGGWVDRAKTQRLAEESRAASQRLIALREKHVEMLGTIAKKRRLEELQQQIDAKRADIEAQQRMLVELQSKREDFINVARRDMQEKREMLSPEDFLEALMLHIKGEIINTSADRPLLQSLHEKIRATESLRFFYDQYATIQKVVGEVTKQPAGRVWPLTPEQARTLPSYHSSVIQGALKGMVCAFDALNLDERSDIAAFRDIINNSDTLLIFAQCGNNYRR